MLQEGRINTTAHDPDSERAMGSQEASVGHHAEHDWAESEGVQKRPQDLP